MYRSSNEGLGFSLKPPSWLRNIVSTVAGGANQAQAAVTAVNANYPAPPGTAPAAFGMPSEVPSWVVPVGLAALAAIFLLPRLSGRRGRRG